MEYTPTGFIRSEKDLDTLENMLKNDINENPVLPDGNSAAKPYISVSRSDLPITDSLYKNIGKLVKVESAIGNGMQSKIGTLIDSGSDYITIRPNKSYCSIVIPLSSVKFITVVHDNNRQRLMNI